jgi:UDP-2,3-diacylglucosamine pyrophosphatase LpxH
MNPKPVTLITSDLHVGGGVNDPGDDHVFDQAQFSTFVREQSNTTEGKQGDIELIINGDFLEFAQVRPEAYTLGSSTHWCAESESLAKLETMLSGHPGIFTALKDFQEKGNSVTIAAGNHDVDLYWPRVQARLREAAGPVAFALGNTCYTRYDDRLVIGHGHMYDPANMFAHWQHPFLTDEFGLLRLEMCPGTIFMVKFVNWLEKDYPFADNIKPVTALARILAKEDRWGMAVVGWMLSRFLMKYPRSALGSGATVSDIGARLLQRIAYDQRFAEQLTPLYRQVRDSTATTDTVQSALTTEDAVYEFLCELLPRVSPDEWLPLFDGGSGGTLAIGGKGKTLAIFAAGKTPEKELLREKAQAELLKPQCQVVVFGHTHQPDEVRFPEGRVYFNPGSWTRYVDLERANAFTLDDLRREDQFPYQLNYVRVEEGVGDLLKAEMVCYQEQPMAY